MQEKRRHWNDAWSSILEDFPEGSVLPLDGVDPSAAPFLADQLRRLGRYSLLAVNGGARNQELFHQDMLSWSSLDSKNSNSNGIYYFPSWEVLPEEERLPEAETLGERLQTLIGLRGLRRSSEPACVVAQVDSILQKTFSPSCFEQYLCTLKVGEECDPLALLDKLESWGYDPVAKVAQKGEFAVRGGIVDIYPLSSLWPVRIEFFGKEVESMREFDPNTQISRQTLEEVLIAPAGEMGILRRQMSALAPEDKLERYALPLLDWFAGESFLLITDPGKVWDSLNLFRSQPGSWSPLIQEWEFLIADFLKRGGRILLVGDSDVIDLYNLLGEGVRILEKRILRMEPPELYTPFPAEGSLELLDQHRERLFRQMLEWEKEGYQCRISFTNPGEDIRIHELWSDHVLGRQVPELVQAAISKGVVAPELKFVLVSDNDIFCRRKTQRSRRQRKAQAIQSRSQLEIDFDHIEEGDIVVHLQHGIAKYQGIGRMPQGAGRRHPCITDSPECLILEFAADDPFEPPPRLYVPVTEAHLVNKYIGVGRAQPPLSRLGGKRWKAARAQAEKAIEDVASDMLRVQALREAEKGFAFAPDSEWQHIFENAFEYEETPDQLQAILDTKRDMEGARPMDRLVCGDVGFGKTEVAIRAAFKAVMSGKQVAVLAPTTVLVQQHFNTFRERMAGYPFRIENISRFRSRKDQNETIRQLALGGIDIVVGTHRLIQKDVHFKDLGLFIVDEEQRFGVRQKERIKKLKALIDVLTLTATPIPRTLYMALSGVKSMSCIQTPPQERLPVKTVVCQYSDEVIEQAIRHELNRQGQVFFLHNRVTSIQSVELKLRKLVPQARIAVGHGQMESDELEEVMSKFVNGEVDILLSTTIIESGLDIPNANTIIIDRADHFGLSELYQLRGRVGRYRHQAYAYLLIPRHAALLADARKRISAIKQYSRLGSGFKIAMRDLEIRGAGNLLGSEQSGHITAIGFDLYCKLLQESISRFKGEKPEERVETRIHLDFLLPEDQNGVSGVPTDSSQLIPLSYINDPVQRLEIYRRLAQARSVEELAPLEEELRDRFGKLPAGVKHLLMVYRVRVIASRKRITEIESRENKVSIVRNGAPLMVHGRLPRFAQKTTQGRLKELLALVESLSI